MIFAQYGYRNFHDGNKDKHPIQPANWDNWLKMVNADEKYCKQWNLLKWIECYFWLFMGRFKWYEVSYYHRHFAIAVNKDRKKSLKDLIRKYEICKKDKDQIKYLFNAGTSLQGIKNKIEEKRKTIL